MTVSMANDLSDPAQPAPDHRAAPQLSVVIPHYNDLDNLRRCLAALDAQALPDGVCEVIVSDNNSPVGIAAVEAVAGRSARVILSTEKGAGPTRNAGAEAARGAILAFTDSDCLPAEGWLAQALASGQKAEITGGRVDLVPADRERPTAVEAFEMVFGFNNEAYIKNKGFSGSGNLVVQRPVFQAVGPFRQGMSEDVEWCHRARAKGHAIDYNHALFVEHPSRQSWGELVVKWKKTTRESYLLIRPRRLGEFWWFARNFVVLVSAIPHSWKVIRSSRLPRWRDKLNALGVLFRVRGCRFAWGLRLSFRIDR